MCPEGVNSNAAAVFDASPPRRTNGMLWALVLCAQGTFCAKVSALTDGTTGGMKDAMAHRGDRRLRMGAAWRVFAVGGLCGVLLTCTTTTIPLTKIPIPVPDLPFRIPFFGKKDLDYSRLGWLGAFDAIHQKLAAEYPFTAHKGIDWASHYEAFAPRISAAEAAEDEAALYVALLEYVYAIPDGNMGLYDDEDIRRDHIGGGLGFGVIQLDDGRVIAHILLDDGPAAAAGMQWGAEIVEYGGTPVQNALDGTPVIWARRPPATLAGRRIEQLRFLTRCPVDSEVGVVFKNLNAAEPVQATLRAVDDGYETLNQTYLYDSEVSDFGSPVEAKVLPSGLGYIRLHFFAPTVTTPFPANAFKSEVASLVRKGVPGLILDVRGNSGGADDLVPKCLGHFFREAVFYEDIAIYDKEAQDFVVKEDAHLRIEPRDPYFEGPVAVLVDYSTFNAAEGVPMALQRRPGTRIAGMSGTFGSMAVGGGYADLPDGRALYFPVGRALNEAGGILGEGNAAGEGGVQPDLRVPLDVDTVRAVYADGEDVTLRYAEEAILAAAP